jgi:hypothetical protein
MEHCHQQQQSNHDDDDDDDPAHPDRTALEIATTLHNIGNIHQQMNDDLSMAIQYFGQCKVLQEQIYGTCYHVDIARTCIAIGHTYAMARAYIDAREAYIDALSIFETMGWSKDHPEYANTWTDRLLLCREDNVRSGSNVNEWDRP